MLNENKKFIAKIIKQARLNAGLTQEQFAEKVDISSKQVSRIECGNFLPLLPTFFKIVEVLNLSLSDFGINTNVKKNKMLDELIKLIYTLNDTELECCYNVIQSQIKNFEILRKSKTKKHA